MLRSHMQAKRCVTGWGHLLHPLHSLYGRGSQRLVILLHVLVRDPIGALLEEQGAEGPVPHTLGVTAGHTRWHTR